MQRERAPLSERIFDRLPALNFALLLLPVLLAALELTRSAAIEATIAPPHDFAELDAPPAPRPAPRAPQATTPLAPPSLDTQRGPNSPAPPVHAPFSDSLVGYGP